MQNIISPCTLAFPIQFVDLQDASSHDGDWNYYKRQAYEQKDVIGQLASLLETHGYDLPKVSREA